MFVRRGRGNIMSRLLRLRGKCMSRVRRGRYRMITALAVVSNFRLLDAINQISLAAVRVRMRDVFVSLCTT